MSVPGRSEVVGLVLTLALTTALYVGCSDDRQASPDTTAAPAEDFEATAADFRNLHAMTPVRGFFVDNRRGHLDEALAIARADEGGEYPVGTILQLVPQEAMVKRRDGWNPATHDWEFFFLDVGPAGTEIVTRGADEVVNRFGGNCASCHTAAEPQFDFVCEQDHGCDPLPIGHDIIEAVQEADPRPA
jgi:hypothetical protein